MFRNLISVAERKNDEINVKISPSWTDTDGREKLKMLTADLIDESQWDLNEMIYRVFSMALSAIQKKYGGDLSVELEEGYLISGDRTLLPHLDAPRIYTRFEGNETNIHFDQLIYNALFDFLCCFYFWSRFPDDQEVVDCCFSYATVLFDYVSTGRLTGFDVLNPLVEKMKERITRAEWNTISDLLWCMILFAFSHEMIHLLKHHDKRPKEDAQKCEFEADMLGYDILLSLIMGQEGECRDDATAILSDRMYTAPMVLFLFYKCAYEYERIKNGILVKDDEHEELESRIYDLIHLSEHEVYQIDTEYGNVILASYWDTVDQFLEMLGQKVHNDNNA